jgi:hypothetical protein
MQGQGDTHSESTSCSVRLCMCVGNTERGGGRVGGEGRAILQVRRVCAGQVRSRTCALSHPWEGVHPRTSEVKPLPYSLDEQSCTGSGAKAGAAPKDARLTPCCGSGVGESQSRNNALLHFLQLLHTSVSVPSPAHEGIPFWIRRSFAFLNHHQSLNSALKFRVSSTSCTVGTSE